MLSHTSKLSRQPAWYDFLYDLLPGYTNCNHYWSTIGPDWSMVEITLLHEYLLLVSESTLLQ